MVDMHSKSQKRKDKNGDLVLEENKSTNWRSIYVASALSFVSSVQFNLFFTSLWPYLQLIDAHASVRWFGYIISIYSLGQILASPVFGYWSNQIKQVRLPMFVGLAFMLSGNLCYLIMVLLPLPVRYTLLLGRFLAGIGTANVCLIRSYVSMASTFEDRQRAIAFVTIGHAVGVTGGPLLQLIFTPLQYPGLQLFGSNFSLNMYTAPAYLALLMNGFGALALYVLFQETYAGIENEEAKVDSTKNERKNSSPAKKLLPSYDRIAAAISYATRFTQMFINTNIETIGAAFAMLMFGWTEAKTVAVTSAAQGAIGVLAFGCYVGYMTLNVEKLMSPRILCIISLAALATFHLLTYSWPFLPDNVLVYNNTSIVAFEQSNGTSAAVGCDSDKFDWCFGMKSVNVYAYYAVYILCLGIAFPTLNVVQVALFSHIIGPRRQGTQQGVFQMSGGMARMIGPILMSTLYSHYGPKMAWNMEILVISITLALWIAFFTRMVPLMESSRARRVCDVNMQHSQSTLLGQSKGSTKS